MKLRRVALGSASLLAIAIALNPGAVMAAPPPYTWTGFYAGVNAGYGWDRAHEREEFGSWHNNGGLFGVQAGYNMHMQGFVVGFEADAMIGSLNGHSDVFFAGKSADLRTKMDWAGTARIRAGVPIENFLIYGTGGLAFSQWTTRLRTDDFGLIETTRDRQLHIGWTGGAGVEWAFTPQLSAKVEYLYADYGKETYRLGGEQIKIDHNMSMIRLGLNFRFGAPPPPP